MRDKKYSKTKYPFEYIIIREIERGHSHFIQHNRRHNIYRKYFTIVDNIRYNSEEEYRKRYSFNKTSLISYDSLGLAGYLYCGNKGNRYTDDLIEVSRSYVKDDMEAELFLELL